MQLFSADATIFSTFFLPMKTNVAHNLPNFFSSTASSCPYGQKFNFHIGNLTEAVISTLCIEV